MPAQQAWAFFEQVGMMSEQSVQKKSSTSAATAGIVGAGSIGVAFSIVFARAGCRVRIWDPEPSRRQAVAGEMAERLAALQEYGLLDEPLSVIGARVEAVDAIADAVVTADFVIECAPERLEVKVPLFREIDQLAPPAAILATASSAIPMSKIADGLPGRQRCLVAHPGNPPYLIPVIELVPAPFTDPLVARRASEFFSSVGMIPVMVQRETEGFVFNRLQGAVLREAYCLVRDGVASVEDIDRVMRDGVGMRWSVIGPFETADLNTRGGIASHALKMGPAYERMGLERGQHDPWTKELVAEVERQRRQRLPLSEWEARVAWRDRQLMKLAKSRREDPL